MKLKAVLAGAFIAGVAMGGCDSSRADLETTRSDLAGITTERDGLKSQLNTETSRESELVRLGALGIAHLLEEPRMLLVGRSC